MFRSLAQLARRFAASHSSRDASRPRTARETLRGLAQLARRFAVARRQRLFELTRPASGLLGTVLKVW
jgi:hypothetical protein